jgi:hypothetical protein
MRSRLTRPRRLQVRHQETEGNMSTGTSHQKDPEKARPAGIFSRRDMLLTGTSIFALSGL